VPVTYYIFPNGAGWRVHSRGFVWDFASGPQAVEFASDMAEQFARASGQATSVRFQDEGGGFHELRGYEGNVTWLPGAQEGAARQATVVPFRRKGL
jgi:hypothetical protein